MNNIATSVIKVLIVEDESAIYDICLRVLTEFGFDVDIASNGRIAKDMIKRKEYDLCIVDIRTPEMSGKELYEWCLKEKPYQASNIIFTTGDTTREETKDFINRSGTIFLPKPFTTNELRVAVRKYFEMEAR
jgi:DNA-binding response OmpR family regulator